MSDAQEMPKAIAAVDFKNAVITIDGRSGNTKVSLNGVEIKNLRSVNLYSCHDPDRPSCGYLSFNFSVGDGSNTKPGTLSETQSFSLRCPSPECASAVATIQKDAETPANMVDVANAREAYRQM